MLYIYVSRTVPSLRAIWWRSTPTLFAPKASIAFCEPKTLRRLRLQLVLRFQFEVAGVVPFVQLP
jgi:hypothetical protein